MQQLSVDILAKIVSYLPLNDDVQCEDGLPFRFVNNIHVSRYERNFILDSYFDTNMKILIEMINSNYHYSLLDSFLYLWDSAQYRDTATFKYLICSCCEDDNQNDDGLVKITISYNSPDGNRLHRTIIEEKLRASIELHVTSYGFPSLQHSKGNYIRSIDNKTVYGMSVNDAINYCLDKYDHRHSGVNLFVTTPMSRERCLDIAFTVPTFSVMNCLDSISNAWVESEAKYTSVSYHWSDLMLSFRNNPLISVENGLYLSSKSIQTMLTMDSSNDNPRFQPVVQIVHIGPIPSSSERRWKIVITDGNDFATGIVALQLNDLVESGDIERYVIIRLNDFATVTLASGRRVFIMMECHPLLFHLHPLCNPIV